MTIRATLFGSLLAAILVAICSTGSRAFPVVAIPGSNSVIYARPNLILLSPWLLYQSSELVLMQQQMARDEALRQERLRENRLQLIQNEEIRRQNLLQQQAIRDQQLRAGQQ